MPESTLEFESEREFHKLYDEKPKNLALVEKILGVSLVARGTTLKISGDEKNLSKCEDLFSLLNLGQEHGFTPKGSDFLRFLEKIESGRTKELRELVCNPLVLKIRKKYWLLPIIIVIFLFGGLIILSQGSAVAPFIYTIF